MEKLCCRNLPQWRRRGIKDEKRSRSIEEKESYRWIHTMNETQQKISENISVLTVCERDSYEFLPETADVEENFLVRIVQNRMVDDGSKQNSM